MSDLVWSRRQLLGASLAGATIASVAGQGALAAAPAAAVDIRPPRFASARDEWLAIIRVQADIEGAVVPWWYTGFLYGVRADEVPRKLVRFEGCEMYRFERTGEGEYRQTARTVTYFQDAASAEVLERFENPYTGRTVDVEANVLGGLGHMLWSDAGLEPVWRNQRTVAPTPHHVEWTALGERIWMRHDRVYPPGLPQPLAEASTMLVDRGVLESGRANVPAEFSSSYIAPWPRWLDMGDSAGHVIWHADGLKLASLDALPAPFLERLRREYPETVEFARG